ncbi:hypothetical protein EGW08_023030, partial [Elysia chlorotica]
QLTQNLTSSSEVGVSRDQQQKDTSSLLVLRRLVRLHLREITVRVNYPAEKMHRSALLDVYLLAVLAFVPVMASETREEMCESTKAPPTMAPTTKAPTTMAPTTRAPPSEAPHKVCYGTRNRPAYGGICGSNIPTTVRRVCENRGKRSGDSIDFSQFKKVDRTRSFDLEKRDAFKFLQKRAGTRGIVCECCYNRCTNHELLEYCAFLEQ